MDNQNGPQGSLPDKDANISDFDFDRFGIGKSEIQSEVLQAVKPTRFPADVFPQAIQDIIRETNEHLNFPVDFIGVSILYAASVAIGNTYLAEVKKGFRESAVLYLAIVARPGTNKTHPLSFALNPIIEKDKRTFREYEKLRREYETVLNLTKKEKQQQGIDEPVKPVWQKFLLSDFTIEALAEVHSFNKRGIGVYVDELAGWFKNFNRYNKGSEMEFWLSAFNSKPINNDRKNHEPIFIPLPFISVSGTIQTGILTELAKDTRTANGFIDRILFCIPDDIIKEYWTDSELHPGTSEAWREIVSSLLNVPVSLDETLNPVPGVLRFSPEARRLLFAWQKENTDKCNEAEAEAIAGIYSKFDMYVVRLALILQMLQHACAESDKNDIGIKATKGAIELIEYFRNSALKVYKIVTSLNPLDKLPANKLDFYNHLPETFTTDTALRFAQDYEINERTVKRFLNERDIFDYVSYGNYKKKF